MADTDKRLSEIHRMVRELHQALVPITGAPMPQTKTSPPTPNPPVQPPPAAKKRTRGP